MKNTDYDYNNPKLKALVKTMYAIVRNHDFTLAELYEDIVDRCDTPLGLNKSIFMESLGRHKSEFTTFKNRTVSIQNGKLVLLLIKTLPLDKRDLRTPSTTKRRQ